MSRQPPVREESLPSEPACEKKTASCRENWTGFGVSSRGTSGTTATPTPEKSRMFLRVSEEGLYRKCLGQCLTHGKHSRAERLVFSCA